MKLSLVLAVVGVSRVAAWGTLGHLATAYVAQHFVDNATEAYFQDVLGNSTSEYLAGIATWADAMRYTRWGQFTKTFHFIDAKDNPPHACNVDLQRDCKATGCVVTSLANYTRRSLDVSLPADEREIAAKFVVHFVGDLHQPLHNENVARGGNGLRVLWHGRRYNLHHVWDTRIAEQWIGSSGRRGRGRSSIFETARKWADQLTHEIEEGKFVDDREAWLSTLNFDDPTATALAWARECNAHICTHVLPEGAEAIQGQELSSGSYYAKAGPLVEKLVAQGGYRLAKWLDHIAAAAQEERLLGEEL